MVRHKPVDRVADRRAFYGDDELARCNAHDCVEKLEPDEDVRAVQLLARERMLLHRALAHEDERHARRRTEGRQRAAAALVRLLEDRVALGLREEAAADAVEQLAVLDEPVPALAA